MEDTLGLAGKVAVVTGSSRGWGRGIAKELARRGVRLVVTGTNPDLVRSALDEVAALGPDAVAVVADLGTRAACESIIDAALDTFGQLDILVNNAGAVEPGLLLDMTEEAWDRSIAVQLSAQFHTSQLAARHMVERGQGGRIINMAGGSAFTGLYANGNHAASKGGAMGAVLTWAQELAPYDITVNALAGSVDTDQAHGFIEKVREERVAAGLPDCTPRELGYYPPEEVASVVVWLASDRASTVTGRYLMPRGPELQIWRMATIERSVFHTGTWTPEYLEEIGLAAIIGAGNGLEERLATEAVTALRRA